MAEFINTIDKLGDDVVIDGIISRTIEEFHDDKLTKMVYGALQSCTRLSNVKMPNLTLLPMYAFASCSALTCADFSVFTSSPGYGFRDCTNLKTLIFRSETAVSVMENNTMLTNTPIASGTGYIYVPRALVDSYKAATNWATYANQIRAIEDYPEITGG